MDVSGLGLMPGLIQTLVWNMKLAVCDKWMRLILAVQWGISLFNLVVELCYVPL